MASAKALEDAYKRFMQKEKKKRGYDEYDEPTMKKAPGGRPASKEQMEGAYQRGLDKVMKGRGRSEGSAILESADPNDPEAVKTMKQMVGQDEEILDQLKEVNKPMYNKIMDSK